MSELLPEGRAGAGRVQQRVNLRPATIEDRRLGQVVTLPSQPLEPLMTIVGWDDDDTGDPSLVLVNLAWVDLTHQPQELEAVPLAALLVVMP